MDLIIATVDFISALFSVNFVVQVVLLLVSLFVAGYFIRKLVFDF